MPKRMNATGEDRTLVPLGGRFVAAGETVDVPEEVDGLYAWPDDWPLADISAPAESEG